ncbi:hypothetical protein D9757_012891 [Collybiopsis confluens]|uniref:HAUS augmin-like complex subunit 6 N-terminal domain-containing protein n=1 Tax=Collybiopsis confluens TaxID=2823264 RepID=A0A8H5LK92_9AGAR|nr:hypothetical protein D9757_012891 [Collybiopsis confluens]
MNELPKNVTELPLPLLLLIHLQILQYPAVNDDQFDIDLFDSHKRGLRARLKLMEDLGYWLVQKLEGRNVKKVLPIYPCIKPSEIIAFRTSFSRYLESLRQVSIKDNSISGVWWRDVQARKSLLEECSGERFLRLMVALSTHVLYKSQARSANIDDPSPALLYASRILDVQLAQRGWVDRAVRLLERETHLAAQRVQLTESSTVQKKPSKYASLSTTRLTALRDAKLEDTLNKEEWSSADARKALEFLRTLRGLGVVESGTRGDVAVMSRPHNRHLRPQLLPITAAHYPSHLRRLEKPVLDLARTKLSELTRKDATNVAKPLKTSLPRADVIMQECLETENRAHNALQEALNPLKREKMILEQRSDKIRARRFRVHEKPSFWTNEYGLRLDFNVKHPVVTDANLSLVIRNEAREARERISRAVRVQDK